MRNTFNNNKIIFVSVIFAILLLIIPFSVNAQNYSSDFIKITDTSYTYEDEDVSLSQVYFNKSSSNFGDLISYGTLFSKMVNLSKNYLFVYMTIDYYDTNYKIIARSTKTEQPTTAKENYSMNIILYANDFLGNYDINDIAYFKINYYKVKGNLLPDFNNINDSNVTNITNTTDNDQYTLTEYKIDIKVNENNTFNISEYIKAYFNVDKHGIFRKIPLRNEVVRLDGTKSNNRAKISDITVNEAYTTYNESGYKVIKIGDSNYTLTGSKEYVINYLYNIGKDTGKEYDEFYFNLLGYEWDTTISNAKFTITMPKEFDKTKLGFSSGIVGSTDSSNIEYNVDGNVISGRYNGVLDAGESLTVRLELPEGYFVGASNNFNFMIIILFVLPIVFAIISFLLWVKYGKDDKAIETVEFYPPEGFNSAEIGFLYKGYADKNDVISLLIYLANKGYVRIEESEEKALFSTKKEFKIVKIKDYDGNNINEKVFLNGLFNSRGSSVTSAINLMKYMKNPQQEVLEENNSQTKLQEVTATDLYDSFYITLNSIVRNLNDKENIRKIFEKSKSGKSLAVILMIIVSLFTIISIPTLEYASIIELVITLFTTLFYIPFYAVIFAKKIPLAIRLILGGFTIFHSMMLFSGLPIKEAIFDDSILLSGFLIGLVCIIAMIFCFKAMSKRTSFGNEMLGKIKGFKNFLETAEKSKLEELVMQNPSYFYNILPFTYVLGVSDKWIKKFETISLQTPDWYAGNTAFSMTSFGSFMNSTMYSASRSMSSSHSSSSGGSSGGGSSGGGSGGGGGGSW